MIANPHPITAPANRKPPTINARFKMEISVCRIKNVGTAASNDKTIQCISTPGSVKTPNTSLNHSTKSGWSSYLCGPLAVSSRDASSSNAAADLVYGSGRRSASWFSAESKRFGLVQIDFKFFA